MKQPLDLPMADSPVEGDLSSDVPTVSTPKTEKRQKTKTNGEETSGIRDDLDKRMSPTKVVEGKMKDIAGQSRKPQTPSVEEGRLGRDNSRTPSSRSGVNNEGKGSLQEEEEEEAVSTSKSNQDNNMLPSGEKSEQDIHREELRANWITQLESLIQDKEMYRDKLSQSNDGFLKLSSERHELTYVVQKAYEDIERKNEQIEENKQSNPGMYDEYEDLLPANEIEARLNEVREEIIRIEQEIPKLYRQYIQDKQLFTRNVEEDCRGDPFKTFLNRFLEMKLRKIIPADKITRLQLLKDIPLPDLMCEVDKSKSRKHTEYKILVGGRQYLMNHDGLFNIMEKLNEMEEVEAETEKSRSGSRMNVAYVANVDNRRASLTLATPSHGGDILQRWSSLDMADDTCVASGRHDGDNTVEQTAFWHDNETSRSMSSLDIADGTSVDSGQRLSSNSSAERGTPVAYDKGSVSSYRKTPTGEHSSLLLVRTVEGKGEESYVAGQMESPDYKLASQEYQARNDMEWDKEQYSEMSNEISNKVEKKRPNSTTGKDRVALNSAATDCTGQANVQMRKKSKKQKMSKRPESDNSDTEVPQAREPHPSLNEPYPLRMTPHPPPRYPQQAGKAPHQSLWGPTSPQRKLQNNSRIPRPPVRQPHPPNYQRRDPHSPQRGPHSPQRQLYPPIKSRDDGHVQRTSSIHLPRQTNQHKSTLPVCVGRNIQNRPGNKTPTTLPKEKKEFAIVDNHDYNRVSKPTTSSIRHVPDMLPSISNGFLMARKVEPTGSQQAPANKRLPSLSPRRETPAKTPTFDAKEHRALLRRQMKY